MSYSKRRWIKFPDDMRPSSLRPGEVASELVTTRHDDDSHSVSSASSLSQASTSSTTSTGTVTSGSSLNTIGTLALGGQYSPSFKVCTWAVDPSPDEIPPGMSWKKRAKLFQAQLSDKDTQPDILLLQQVRYWDANGHHKDILHAAGYEIYPYIPDLGSSPSGGMVIAWKANRFQALKSKTISLETVSLKGISKPLSTTMPTACQMIFLQAGGAKRSNRKEAPEVIADCHVSDSFFADERNDDGQESSKVISRENEINNTHAYSSRLESWCLVVSNVNLIDGELYPLENVITGLKALEESIKFKRSMDDMASHTARELRKYPLVLCGQFGVPPLDAWFQESNVTTPRFEKLLSDGIPLDQEEGMVAVWGRPVEVIVNDLLAAAGSPLHSSAPGSMPDLSAAIRRSAMQYVQFASPRAVNWAPSLIQNSSLGKRTHDETHDYNSEPFTAVEGGVRKTKDYILLVRDRVTRAKPDPTRKIELTATRLLHVPELKDGTILPNPFHPSTHLPIMAEFAVGVTDIPVQN